MWWPTHCSSYCAVSSKTLRSADANRRDTSLELGEVLPVLQRLDEILAWPFLLVRQGVEHLMPFEEAGDHREALLQTRF